MIGKFIIVVVRKAKAMYLILKRLWSEYTSKKESVVEIRPEISESFSDNKAVYVAHPSN